jgi:hypothetical protein
MKGNTGKGKKRFIDGFFWPWKIDMGNSAAMKILRKNADAVNVFTMFGNKFSKDNKGKGLCVTYQEAGPFMSPATFRKALFWLMALGFIHCVRAGRLERKASIYDLSEKWRHLSSCPDKLARIEKLLRRHDLIARIPLKRNGKVNIRRRGDLNPTLRKKMVRMQIEKAALIQ